MADILPVVEVLESNVSEVLPNLLQAIDDASFIALDLVSSINMYLEICTHSLVNSYQNGNN